MNEKYLWELWAKCKHPHPKQGGGDMVWPMEFAELIVKECVGIVNKIVPPGYEDYPDYRDQIEQSFRSECATEIKKHFGVE
jgi:hypothetical protein